MKFYSIYLAISIFCISHICNAQTVKPYYFLLCDAAPGNISKIHVNEILDKNCRLINLSDSMGNEIEILRFTFALANENKETGAYYEPIEGNSLSEEAKKRLKNAKAGDMFVIQNIVYKAGKDLKVVNGFTYKVTN